MMSEINILSLIYNGDSSSSHYERLAAVFPFNYLLELSLHGLCLRSCQFLELMSKARGALQALSGSLARIEMNRFICEVTTPPALIG